jgi:lipopolysaccharide transport system ATP-binding protein
MSQPVISVESLSKSYQLGVIGTGTFYGDLKRWWARQRGKPDPYLKVNDVDHGNRDGETIWALKDVNFGVRQGEAMGIIGRNGAGKSTLLKVLSQVTAPTSGVVKIKGRIASLLEVGTGFHPELTGRENIHLNGAILGMSRVEVQHKFDEIVDFSGVEQFIDTPVKRYSSGMYVRLAFAVAAHLESDILIVDEVLAVGDAEFQKKCLGKMDDVSHKDGRTILFVSHNMGMIHSLCNRAILLDAGSAVWDGQVSEAISRYYNSGKSSPFALDYSHLLCPPGDEYATLLEGRIEDENGKAVGEIDISVPFTIKMKYKLKKDVPISPYANIHVYNSQGQPVFITGSERRLPVNQAGIYEAICTIPGNLLNNDTYSIGLALTFTHNGIHISFFEQNALTVTVHETIDETLEKGRNGYSGAIPGAVRPKLDWMVKRLV